MKSITPRKSAYFCQSCGAEYPKWQGQCGECGNWNTLAEGLATPKAKARAGNGLVAASAGCSGSTKFRKKIPRAFPPACLSWTGCWAAASCRER